MSERSSVPRDDTGAYLVMYAVLAIGVFSVVALVLDMAALRQGRQVDRAAADLAATSGAGLLDPADLTSAAAACQAAWDYLALNHDDDAGTVSAPNCAATFPAVACDPLTAATAVGTLGPLTVSITSPVPNADTLMRSEVAGGDVAQAIDVTRDGDPCDRLAVRVQRTRAFLFGDLLNLGSTTTDVHAVARGVITSGLDVPAAVALDGSGCEGVLVNTGASLTVTPSVSTDPDTIVVDTDLSGCAAPGVAVQVTGATLSAGEIESVAMAGANAARTLGGITATPITGVTDALGTGFLSLRYDCGAPCDEAQGELTALHAQYSAGVPGGLLPSGLVPLLGVCTVPAATNVTIAFDAYVDCPTLRVEGSLTFAGAATVFNGSIIVTETGCLAMNDAACSPLVAIGATKPAVVAYVRGGLQKEAKGELTLTNTFTYLTGTVDLPVADPFGSSVLDWSAPQSGSFEDLAMWTDGAAGITIGEQQTTALEGTLVAPNATITLEGKGSPTPLSAQLVGARIHVGGNDPVVLSPSAGRATGRVAHRVKLIR